MLTHIGLKNFKCFEELELSPALVTVFIGPNGTGKSSVLQALMLLRQSLRQGQALYGTSQQNVPLQLGGFEEVVFRKDVGRTVTIELGGSLPESTGIFPLMAAFAYLVKLGSTGLTESTGEVAWKEHSFEASWPKDSRRQSSGYTIGSLTGSLTVSVRAQQAIGQPFEVGSSSSGDPSLDDRERANKVGNLLGNGIPGHIERWWFLSSLRGFGRSAYPLQAEPVEQILVEDSLDNQAAKVASTMGMRQGRRTRERISRWMQQVTEVGLAIETERQQQVAPQAIRQEVPENIYLVNEGFATNQLVFLFFQLANAPRFGLVGIEEPEIHLHPAAQARLADLFVEVAKEEQKQLILTTHSEHILFSLLNNVAEGKLAPEELAVYAFERQGAACTAHKLEVTKEGMVKGGIPGFFDASLDAQKRHLDAMTKLAQPG